MRRTEIAQGVEEITRAISHSNLIQAVRAAMTTSHRTMADTTTRIPADAMEAILSSLQTYSVFAANFSDATKEIAEIFNLSALTGTKFWQLLLSPDRDSMNAIYEISEALNLVTNHLPQVIELLESDTLAKTIKGIDSHHPKYADRGIIRLILIDNDENPSSPRRLSDLLEGTQTLYNVCALINQEPTEELRIIACDSGSDQSFDLVGAAKVVDCVKELILSMWDRIVYFRELQMSQRIKLVAETLPLLEQLAKLEERNGISAEEATRLRYGLAEGAGKFLASKAIIAEMEKAEVTRFNPRQLIAPEQKLLSAHAHDSIEENALSEEEQATLKHLQERAIRQTGSKTENETDDRL